MELIKLKAKLGFYNDDTGYRYEPGDVFEVTQERFDKMKKNAETQGIILSDYVEVLKENKGAAAPKK